MAGSAIHRLETLQTTAGQGQTIQDLQYTGNWASLGKHLQTMMDSNVFLIETDLSGTSEMGFVEPWDFIDTKIYLNPDLFSGELSNMFINTISHEFVHYSQIRGVPILGSAIGAISNVADIFLQKITGNNSIYFPTSVQNSAYQIGARVSIDVGQ